MVNSVSDNSDYLACLSKRLNANPSNVTPEKLISPIDLRV